MKLTFLCFGSRGDVQPYIALGVGFSRSGHAVRIATHEIFRDIVVAHGLEFAPVHGNPRELLDMDSMRAALGSGANWFRLVNQVRKIADTVMQEMLESAIPACQGSDALLYGVMGVPAYHLADYWNIPRFPVLLQPATRTSAFPAMSLPELPLGRLYNRLSWRLEELAFWAMLGSFVDNWRQKRLGLPSLKSGQQRNELYLQKMPFTYGFSEFVIPRPPDYPAWHRIAGYWFLDQVSGWSAADDLLEFLGSGAPPVYIGFGSMNAGESERITRIVLEAIKQSACRAVLLKGWGGLQAESLPDHVFMVDSIPHEWLFPQMRAIVHHGGAGTTAAAFRAGVPQVVCPHFADQPFWARHVQKLGVGTKPVYMNKLTVDDLAGAIRQAVTDNDLRTRAAELGRKIRSEDGVSRAVEIISDVLESI
jgi:UDP:flavonoid glycosyltransferase YjiC (YdhE family)